MIEIVIKVLGKVFLKNILPVYVQEILRNSRRFSERKYFMLEWNLSKHAIQITLDNSK